MFREDSPNPLEKEAIGIEGVETFDALYELIRGAGEVQGTIKNYSVDELIRIIEQVRHGHSVINQITRSYGIREAVERLLPGDSVYEKYTKGSKAKK